MATIVITNTAAAKTAWNNQCSDCCGSPGGMGTCCYVMFCPCCAAGDVAAAAGRDYCCSCFVMPLMHVFVLGFLMRGIWWSGDRDALAKKYNVQDPFEGCTSCIMMSLPCYCCMLIQELNHIKAVELKGGLVQQSATTVIVPAQAAMKV